MYPDGSHDSAQWRRFAEGSTEQQILLALGTHLNLTLRPHLLTLAQDSRVEVEGIDAAREVIVQMVPNQGAYKPAYRNKVLADMFKLLWLRSSIPTAKRAILVVTPVTGQAFNGWVRVAAEELGIDVYFFDGHHIAERENHA